MLTKYGPDGSIFKPITLPRMSGIQEGAVDGYHPLWSVMCEPSDGLIPVITPGLGKRDTLRRLKRSLVVQAYVRENWEALRGCLGEVLGYKRRTETSLAVIEHVDWLFRRHILHESTAAIAEMAGKGIPTV